MRSRSEKYLSDNSQYTKSRTNKNSNLYKDISNSELNDYSLASNAKVIGENDSNYVNVDKIKEILEKNYHGLPKRREVKLVPEIEEKKIELEQTKEYDINAILEKAREEKEVNYEKERLKKVRDTQYDILKNLDFNEEKEKENEFKASDSKTKDELLELINTITENEMQKTKLDPLDILSDLKGDENTMVLGAKEDLEESMKIFEDENDLPTLEMKKEQKSKKEKEEDSFYTGNLSFRDSDFDDFDDLKKDINSNRNILIIISVIVILLAIAGIVNFLNSSLKLELF